MQLGQGRFHGLVVKPAPENGLFAIRFYRGRDRTRQVLIAKDIVR